MGPSNPILSSRSGTGNRQQRQFREREQFENLITRRTVTVGQGRITVNELGFRVN